MHDLLCVVRWAIYIGPQQMKEPGGGGPGCMLYPFLPCPTNPRVPITGITLRNIQIDGTLLSPGIIRCNESAPCTDFVWDNVQLTNVGDFPFGYDYFVEHTQGLVINSSPAPGFAPSATAARDNAFVDAAADDADADSAADADREYDDEVPPSSPDF